jgi:DNA-binding NarL/FixJ family response regulator
VDIAGGFTSVVEERPGLATTRVAVLDAQFLVRDSLSRVFLQQPDLEFVGQYSSVSQMMDGLTNARPDILLMDLFMVASDWVGVLQEVQRQQPSMHVLVLSEQVERAVVDRCFEAGVSGYLDKNSAGCESVLEAVRMVARGELVAPARSAWTPASTGEGHTNVPSGVLHSLSARQREVLSYLAGGADNLKIAAMLGVCERTVKGHVSNLYRKLGRENRAQLALFARELGIRPPAGL